MRVLVACEFSGIVRDAFIAEGHDAISCDLLPTERPGPHIQGDVRPLLQEPWDLVVAHPPCNYLSNVNSLWGHEARDWFPVRQKESIKFFLECLNVSSRVAVENPTMLGSARKVIGPPSDVVQPYEFGDGYSKRTCLWLRGLPPLMRTCIVPHKNWVTLRAGVKERHHGSTQLATKDDKTKHDRSRFWPGIAAAMAKQWGNL